LLLYVLRETNFGQDTAKFVKRNRIARKIMGIEQTPSDCRNSVPTVLVDSPRHLQGDDYAIDCIACSSSDSWRRPIKWQTKFGVALLRRNWPDMFHTTIGQTDRELSQRLETATNPHFAALQREKAEKLTQRQKLAGLAKRLRSLEELSLADSYSAGNCQMGTAQFVASLGLSLELGSIRGRDLAKHWRKAKFPQVERLSYVVSYLESIPATQLEEVSA
jgi:hypothetical protein